MNATLPAPVSAPFIDTGDTVAELVAALGFGTARLSAAVDDVRGAVAVAGVKALAGALAKHVRLTDSQATRLVRLVLEIDAPIPPPSQNARRSS